MPKRRKAIKVEYEKIKDNWGLSDDSSSTIELDKSLKGKKHLEILIHEAFHCLFTQLSEDEVVSKSITLTNLLWKEHYRRVDNDNSIPLQDGKK